MRGPRRIAAAVIVGHCAVGAVLILWLTVCGGGRCMTAPSPATTPPPLAAQTFEACVAAGYPVMESWPRQCRTPDGRTLIEPPERAELDDHVYVDSPLPDAVVRSPLVVSGAARGPWYFEASFPVRLLGVGKE